MALMGGSRSTDNIGILLHARVLEGERAVEALHQLPQRLVLWLPRHGGEWFAAGGLA
jgi:hypothetical protein